MVCASLPYFISAAGVACSSSSDLVCKVRSAVVVVAASVASVTAVVKGTLPSGCALAAAAAGMGTSSTPAADLRVNFTVNLYV